MVTHSIVITGSTSGIGYGLADSFLSLGCVVTISGRSHEKIEKAAKTLSKKHGNARVFSHICDVTDFQQVKRLWEAARTQFGHVDIWINNAGTAHPETEICNYPAEKIKDVVDTNIIGAMHGSVVALQGMKEQGSGAIYNLEGLGSDGRVIRGMALYGTTKSAVSYLTKAMAKEVRGTPVIAGGIRPGMVATRLITEQYDGHPEEWEKVKGIFNILSDRVETVTPWLAKKILSNKKNGVTISWLDRWKLTGRFLAAPFHKRHIYD
ncbi:MAG: SDR family oxidoreductase [Dehalococcoidales bacterium]|nr:SDR family oxidoreductase [Dehalococcoidales bacterium]